MKQLTNYHFVKLRKSTKLLNNSLKKRHFMFLLLKLSYFQVIKVTKFWLKKD